MLLWSLGNLTLLIGPHNGRVQNNAFHIKAEKLNGRALKFVSAQKVYTGVHNPDLVFTPDGRDGCEERGEKMTK